MFNRKRRRGFSLIELLIVVAIILIIVTMAVPRFVRFRMYTQETAAIKAISTIHTAQTMYHSQFNRYASSLAELGPPASGTPNQSAAELINNDLAGGSKQGYTFTVTGSAGGYVVIAMPVTYNGTGSRSFYSDQSMVVHEHSGPEQATAQDPEMK